MTRFDEVARLRELDAEATCAPWILLGSIDFQIVSDNPEFYINFEDSDRVDPELITRLRNAAPWLLEAAACFQPGDDEILELFETYLAAHRPGGHLIEDGPTTADGIDCIRRLRRAMEIMEGQE